MDFSAYRRYPAPETTVASTLAPPLSVAPINVGIAARASERYGVLS